MQQQGHRALDFLQCMYEFRLAQEELRLGRRPSICSRSLTEHRYIHFLFLCLRVKVLCNVEGHKVVLGALGSSQADILLLWTNQFLLVLKVTDVATKWFRALILLLLAVSHWESCPLWIKDWASVCFCWNKRSSCQFRI